MNLFTIAEILRTFRDKNPDNNILPFTTNIDVDVENSTFYGEHTDDDTITLEMPNGDKWQITMEEIS